MNRVALLSFAALTSSLFAQSNVVAGLDGRLTLIDNLTYYGRRGAAYPNGEVGMAMLNEMCNPGTVNIPWQQAMQPNHPKFGFLFVRVSGDRIEQISDWSYVKHAFLSLNNSGPCGTCQSTGGLGGTVMGVNCSDAYAAGNNADRYWLGPPEEINPWLGTWNPVGSYFDQGDPNVGGTAAADGVRSLSQTQVNAFDPVKHRLTVKEIDLQTAGATYFYGIHLIHQGEAVANRGDNLASRGTLPTWNGSTWSFPNAAAYPMTHGSILTRWPGADVQVGQNGNDDGRIFVASVVRSLGGGLFHYEYAVHNCDNDRGGATFRIPIDAAAVASNLTFRDIDTDPLNDWVGARVGNEIVWTAPATNPLNWNRIYNFGFDATVAPANGVATIDEARVGPGALSLTVGAKVPSGTPTAQATSFGTGCGTGTPCFNSFYETSFDLANSGFTLDYNAGNYTLGALTGSWITPAGVTVTLANDASSLRTIPFSLPYMGGTTTSLRISSNGFVSVGTNANTPNPTVTEFLSGQPRWAALWHDLDPSAGGTILFDATAARTVISYSAVPNRNAAGTATFQLQFYPNGTVHVIYQAVTTSSNSGYLVGFTRGVGAPDPGSIDISATLPTGLTMCNPPVLIQPVTLTASARPIVGTTINLDTTNIPNGSLLGVWIQSTTGQLAGVDLGFLGMPGCRLYAGLDVLSSFATPGTSASVSWLVPNIPAALGVVVYNQTAVMNVGANPFGFLSSNGVELIVGVN